MQIHIIMALTTGFNQHKIGNLRNIIILLQFLSQLHACIGKDQNFFPIFLKHEKRKQEVFKWCDIESELQTAEPTGSAKCSDFFHNLTPASPDVRRACHDSVRVTGTFVYRRLCWRFVVMTVPFTQEIKFKHLRNNSQLDKYLCIDIVKDLSAEFNYSNLKL